MIGAEVDEIVAVSDAEVAEATRTLFADTHNVAEGAGAACLAGATQQHERWKGKRIGITVTGANVDSDMLARVLLGEQSTERASHDFSGATWRWCAMRQAHVQLRRQRAVWRY